MCCTLRSSPESTPDVLSQDSLEEEVSEKTSEESEIELDMADFDSDYSIANVSSVHLDGGSDASREAATSVHSDESICSAVMLSCNQYMPKTDKKAASVSPQPVKNNKCK